jgi:hypothetical protein
VAGGTTAPLGIDTTVPTTARMYDYWLGGHDNFAVDRAAALAVSEAAPEMKMMAGEPQVPAPGCPLPGRRGGHRPVPGHRDRAAHPGQRPPGRPAGHPGRPGRLRRQRPLQVVWCTRCELLGACAPKWSACRARCSGAPLDLEGRCAQGPTAPTRCTPSLSRKSLSKHEATACWPLVGFPQWGPVAAGWHSPEKRAVNQSQVTRIVNGHTGKPREGLTAGLFKLVRSLAERDLESAGFGRALLRRYDDYMILRLRENRR